MSPLRCLAPPSVKAAAAVLPSCCHRAEYEMPPWVSPAAADLLGRMMDVDVAVRATIDELWEHPWVKGSLVRRSPMPSGSAALARGDGAAAVSATAAEEEEEEEEMRRRMQQDIFGERVEVSGADERLARPGSSGARRVSCQTARQHVLVAGS